LKEMATKAKGKGFKVLLRLQSRAGRKALRGAIEKAKRWLDQRMGDLRPPGVDDETWDRWEDWEGGRGFIAGQDGDKIGFWEKGVLGRVRADGLKLEAALQILESAGEPVKLPLLFRSHWGVAAMLQAIEEALPELEEALLNSIDAATLVSRVLEGRKDKGFWEAKRIERDVAELKWVCEKLKQALHEPWKFIEGEEEVS
jgi:hypothetical protein